MNGVSSHRKVRLELSPCVHRQFKKEKASGIELRPNKGSCLKGRGKKGIGYLKIYFNLTLPSSALRLLGKKETDARESSYFFIFYI